MRIKILYESPRGGSGCIWLLPEEDLYGRLNLLRKRGVKLAEAWTVDDFDARIEEVGGIEETDGADDRRIKYQVWADANAKA